MAEAAKRRPGRPRKYAEGSRFRVSPRLTKRTYAALVAASLEAGRSISEEVEYRIQRSFDHQASLDDIRRAVAEGKAQLVWNPSWLGPTVAAERGSYP